MCLVEKAIGHIMNKDVAHSELNIDNEITNVNFPLEYSNCEKYDFNNSN